MKCVDRSLSNITFYNYFTVLVYSDKYNYFAFSAAICLAGESFWVVEVYPHGTCIL